MLKAKVTKVFTGHFDYGNVSEDILALNRRKNMNKLIIAVDPGKKGAISAMMPDGSIWLYPIPLIGKEVDINGMSKIFKDVISGEDKTQVRVIVEDVHSIFGVGAKANFQFGRVLGFIEGILSTLEIPFIKVSSKAWQDVAFQGIPVMKKPGKAEKGRGSNDTKAMALLAATRLYPSVKLTLTARATKPHDGAVDALLMCHYAKIKNL